MQPCTGGSSKRRMCQNDVLHCTMDVFPTRHCHVLCPVLFSRGRMLSASPAGTAPGGGRTSCWRGNLSSQPQPQPQIPCVVGVSRVKDSSVWGVLMSSPPNVNGGGC